MLSVHITQYLECCVNLVPYTLIWLWKSKWSLDLKKKKKKDQPGKYSTERWNNLGCLVKKIIFQKSILTLKILIGEPRIEQSLAPWWVTPGLLT